MSMVRIKEAVPLNGQRLRLTLTDGRTLERDVGPLMVGPVFESIRNDPAIFKQVRVEHGTVVWPGDVDLCPDVLIGDGPPPQEETVVNDNEIASRLEFVSEIWTPKKNFRNKILQVHPHSVVVRSDKTEHARTIEFSDIRNAGNISYKPPNSRIILSLRQILGLPLPAWESSVADDEQEE